MMSKILTKTVKKTTLLSVILAVILAAAIAVGLALGLTGNGVFNKSELLKDSKTLSVTVNHYVYETKLEEVQDACEEVFADLDVVYTVKGEMSGDESELVYVFDKGVDLSNVETALEQKFEALKNNEWKDILVFITVATNTETAVAYLAEYYVLGGVFAGIALAALVFAYVAVRFGLNKGFTALISTVVGILLTVALVIITRIPVTASVAYVFAAAGLLSAITSLFTLNKIRANEKANPSKSAEEIVTESLAEKEILLLCALSVAALIFVGAIATAGVRWFAVLSLIAVLAAAFVGLVYAPAVYLPIKAAADKKPAKDGYVGAVKTSKKEKKETVETKAVPETVEEVTEESAEEVAEEPAEEIVEEVVEEPVTETAEETVEEVAEEVTEEPAEEVIEEPAEEPATETVEESIEEAQEPDAE